MDSAHWIAILTSCSGYEPYHKQCVAADAGVSVADFLIFDPLFPRSVLYCLRACMNAAHAIAGRPLAEPDNDDEKGLTRLIERLATNNIETLVNAGLHEALVSIVNEIQAVGDAIQVKYFDVDQSEPVQ